jgi:DNA-binding NarL/FixJ family response regulator
MDKANGDRIVTPASTQFGREPGITLADKGWSVFSGPEASLTNAIPASRASGQLAVYAADNLQKMPWRAADRALAEIAAANRDELLTSGRDRARLERAVTTVRDALNEAAVAAAEAARRALALAEALDDTLATLNEAQTRRPAPAMARSTESAAGNLSQREQEVLKEVAKGRSNKAIADALYVSPNTVKTHVTSLLRKLNVDTRAQLAAIAVQQGM